MYSRAAGGEGMKMINAGTNLHCPKCGNDIAMIMKTVPLDTIVKDNRRLKCHWPGCDRNGMYCDLVERDGEQP